MMNKGEKPEAEMRRLIGGFILSRAIYAAAQLGLADLIGDRPKTADELAEATSTNTPSLYRVLRFLASAGIFTEDDQQHFALTPLGATLRSDVPNSLRAWALLQLGGELYQAWGDVLHSVKTGETAFSHVFGMGVWLYRSQHAEHAAIFNEAMANLTRTENMAAIASYDFSPFGRIVDVGGGNGAFAIALLRAHPEMRVVVFDLPHVAEHAQWEIAAAGLSDRCEVVAGSFFEAIPGGADAYTLSRVIHDWQDDESIAILRNCRRAMAPQSKLLLIERVIPDRVEPSGAHQSLLMTDLIMLAMAGGRERTEAEYRALFEHAGFTLTRIVPTESSLSVIEAMRMHD